MLIVLMLAATVRKEQLLTRFVVLRKNNRKILKDHRLILIAIPQFHNDLYDFFVS
jgi:hypothetical protein